ncbi:hypothetical protein [Methanolobus halotolerans]|uniref:Uncharacterized protein n=1 Tax=Methanolobus halotolerans TaxID=2052935 RepID=A0A4E0PXF6_9EURY|nr:hypothetical protein [Methanolobus halotolerans]TGC07889.1 hypothetical protein CUN85_10615 [Methanolobus halotolerans]
MNNSGGTVMGLMVLITIVIVTIATFSLGCTEETANGGTGGNNINNSSNDYTYDDAGVEEVEVMVLESFPVQVRAVATGYHPDGCTEIDEDNTTIERDGNTFNVNLRTIRPRDAICTQALVPFEQTIDLDVYGLEKGIYTVNVNGVEETFELTADNIIS